MVKRTLVVLSVLSLTLMVAGTSFGFIGGGCGAQCNNAPLYVPVDCPDTGVSKTIVTTWECKIEGPCPAPMPGWWFMQEWTSTGNVVSHCLRPSPTRVRCFSAVLMAYMVACLLSAAANASPCGSPFGGGLGGFFGAGTAMLSGDSTIFGALW